MKKKTTSPICIPWQVEPHLSQPCKSSRSCKEGPTCGPCSVELSLSTLFSVPVVLITSASHVALSIPHHRELLGISQSLSALLITWHKRPGLTTPISAGPSTPSVTSQTQWVCAVSHTG